MTDYVDSDLTSAYAHFQDAAAGDHVLLTNGTYNNPTRKDLTKTTGSTVTFAAQNTGGVTITGQPIDLPDDNTIFQGFDLQYNITTDGGTYVTIDGAGCQMTRNKIHFANIPSPGTQKWIRIKGNNCTFDHNEVYGKTTIEDMVLVDKNSSTAVTGCKILYNYFHDFIQNPGDTKSEVIRYGESTLAFLDFNGEIAYNRIENIDADTEILSIKCTNVNIHHNTFKDTLGSLVLRQAYNCIVTANVLINTGLRFYGSGHTITRNQIIDDSVGGVSAACVIGSGDLEDLEFSAGVAGTPGQVIPSNSNYARVKSCIISNNIWANGNASSGNIVALGNDGSRAFQPTGNTITNNIVQASTGTLTHAITGSFNASWSANTVSGNILYPTGTATVGDMPGGGYTNTNPNLKRLVDGSYRCAYYVDAAEVGPLSP